jgi:hypothetical protein
VKRLGAFALGAVVLDVAACSVVSKSDYTFGEGGGDNEGGGGNGASGGGGKGGSSAMGSAGEAGSDTGSGGSGGKGGSSGQGGSGLSAGTGPVAGTGPIAGTAGTMPTDPCNPNPCENDAECSIEEDRYYCRCEPGFEGLRCQVNLDDCVDMPCQNGGTCVDGANTYSCDCQDGFEGAECEIVSDPCESNPCQNGGRCSVTANGPVCGCDTGWEGERCEINHDDCGSNPCQNEGTCRDELNDFSCACQVGWEGDLCEVPVNDCPGENPCQHGGACQDADSGYVCVCGNGYTGLNCETPKVLLIPDGPADLVEGFLRMGGIDVTVTELDYEYDADPHPPGDYCAVLHLNGETYDRVMPLAGQEALRAYVVEGGGGYIGQAWNGYELAKLAGMQDLILIPYQNGHEGSGQYALTTEGRSHPVTAGLPESFEFNSGFSEGACPTGATALALEVGYQHAICVADVGYGRVVDFNHAGHYGNVLMNDYATYENPYIQQVTVQAVNWACRR